MVKQNIAWKKVLVYTPMSNDKAEKMVGTMEKSISIILYKDLHHRDKAIHCLLVGYRRRCCFSGWPAFELLYSITSRTHLERIVGDRLKDLEESERTVEVSALVSLRSSHTQFANEPWEVTPGQTSAESHLLLVTHGNSLTSTVKLSAFSSRYYGPYRVVQERHYCCQLVYMHGSHTQQGTNARSFWISHRKL